MARWLNWRHPGPVELPAWVRDPRTDDDQAWAWAEAVYADGDPGLWGEVFDALISVPRYPEGGCGPAR